MSVLMPNPPLLNNKLCRILIAEDSVMLLNIMAKIFRGVDYNYDVITAENGKEALALFQQEQPDLVLMDASMPEMDGITACQKIRQLEKGQQTPILIVTGHSEAEAINRAYAAGATDYIVKPINWEMLRNRVAYILQIKQSQDALLAEKEKAQVTLESIGDGVITTNEQHIVEYINPVASQLTGWNQAEAIGKKISQVFNIVDENTKTPISLPLPKKLVTIKPEDIAQQILLQHRLGELNFAIESTFSAIQNNQEIIGMVLVFHDVTESREMARKIEYQANHDPLTGLINRREFERRLSCLVDEAQHKNNEHTLFYMDLDRFKYVNDAGTHAAGDELLRQVSILVSKRIRHNDTAARLGGDEFGFLLQNCPLEDALPIAETLCQAIESLHFHWEKHLFTIGASIGVVVINRVHADANKILNMADIACAAAKNAGRNQVHVYQESDKQIPQATEWLSLLNNNLENNLFCLYRQDIINIDNNQSKHGEFYEILVRMRDNNGQLILPGAFFSAAERYNLLLNVDHWIIKHVCEWLSQDQQRLQNLHLISLNLSSSSLASTQLADFIIQQLTVWQLPPHKFCFEFTEQSAITHLQTLPTLLNKLKAHGCSLALDNFGMGLSSFMALKDLPIDYLKIQGTFIQGILDNPVDHEIVKAINNISHAMGIKTIAECVEEKDSTMPILKNLGMDYAQGYALAEPKPL